MLLYELVPKHFLAVESCTHRVMERCSILSDARVVSQRGDNSCLFHSLSFCFSYDGIVPSIHDDMSGFRLREQIFSYIRDNEDVVISISPDEQRTLSEAVGLDGYTCSSYCAKMLDRMECSLIAFLREYNVSRLTRYNRYITLRFHF